MLGRNGAGKSTLLKSISNSGPRVEGQVKFEGETLGKRAWFRRAKGGLAFVPEDRRIFTNLTVRQNLELALHAAGTRTPRMTVEMVGDLFPLLKDLQERLGYQLSGGQQQLVAVARGLMASPKVLLLDEPAEGLAPKVAHDLALQVGRARERLQLTLLLAEQSVAYARQCAEYVYLLDSGNLVFEGDWAQFDAQPALKTQYLAV